MAGFSRGIASGYVLFLRLYKCLDSKRTYLVDGVAINGVSGGPTFALMGQDMDIIGVVSAYILNREIVKHCLA